MPLTIERVIPGIGLQTLTRDVGGDTLTEGDNTRPCTAAESAILSRVENEATLRTKAQQALTANATYLGLQSPTAAQNTAQVKALTRQVNALIRLAVGQLDDTVGT